MKFVTISAATLMIGLSMGSAVAAGSMGTDLSTENNKVSYAIGVSIGENFKRQSIDVNSVVVAAGIKDALAGDDALQMSKKDLQSTMMNFQKGLVMKRQAMAKKAGEANVKVGQDYHASNKAKPGVITLPSGIQYRVIKEGTGEKPSKNDAVTVNYEGKLINGKVFDSSYKRGKPATFQVSQVIPGWVEILQMMKKGATWEVTIPPKLAYGERGVGNMIGPNATLLFKIDLIDVKKKEAAKPNGGGQS